LLLRLFPASAQTGYWQQELQYKISVKLNDQDQSLDAFESIQYTNHSPDTLLFIWFHLWPNAFKNDRTAFSEQMLQNGDTKFYFGGRDYRGYINRLDFRVDEVSARTEDHPQDIDVLKLILPKPLPPGHSITITTLSRTIAGDQLQGRPCGSVLSNYSMVSQARSI
jgi:hypothetical protein